MTKRPASACIGTDVSPDDIAQLRWKLDESQKTNLDLSRQLETMKHRNEELMSQIEVLKAENGKACDNSKYRSLAAYLESGEQLTLNVPTSVCPDDIMQAAREYLCCLGQGLDPNFKVLQGDQDIYDVDGSEECQLFGPLIVVLEASSESDCGEDGDQKFYLVPAPVPVPAPLPVPCQV